MWNIINVYSNVLTIVLPLFLEGEMSTAIKRPATDTLDDNGKAAFHIIKKFSSSRY